LVLCDTHQLDRTETVWQMDSKDCNSKWNDGWNTYQGNKASGQKSETSDELSGNCDPSHEVRQWDLPTVGEGIGLMVHGWKVNALRQ
jgi:hypothetical protein